MAELNKKWLHPGPCPWRATGDECPVCDDPVCECGNPGWACDSNWHDQDESDADPDESDVDH